jgi:aryl-phospho-beta-D-glucosidase BglC (GH1 family)
MPIRRFPFLVLLAALLPAFAAEDAPAPAPATIADLGVNLSGAEYGKAGGLHGKDYTYPSKGTFAYYAGKGLRLIRLPFKWERMQPQVAGPLDAGELKLLDGAIALAREHGVRVIIEPHNYARYHGRLVGGPDIPASALGDLWAKLAAHYASEDTVCAYGLMNEPHGTDGTWPTVAQAAVDGVRTVDKAKLILVPGDSWSGAHSWPKANPNLVITDPGNNYAFEAHQYFDKDCSGTYKHSYDDEKARPDIGVERLQPFLTWIAERKVRGFIGEFGVPDNDPRWMVVLECFVAEMQRAGVGGTYWAGGSWFSANDLSIDPRKDGSDRPQLGVLQKAIQARAEPKPAAP